MKKNLASTCVSAAARLRSAGERRAEAGMATAEWALVTLAVCALAVTLITFLGGPGAKLIEGIVKQAFASR